MKAGPIACRAVLLACTLATGATARAEEKKPAQWIRFDETTIRSKAVQPEGLRVSVSRQPMVVRRRLLRLRIAHLRERVVRDGDPVAPRADR